MLKYVNSEVVFREIPDEITLAINISNCPCHCKGCHSSYLAQDIGEELTTEVVLDLIEKNPGITCVAFMGGDNDPEAINKLASELVKIPTFFTNIAWYSGRDELSNKIALCWFDYIKLGHYDPDRGPLDSPTTNQKLYTIETFYDEEGDPIREMHDITHKFWRKDGN